MSAGVSSINPAYFGFCAFPQIHDVRMVCDCIANEHGNEQYDHNQKEGREKSKHNQLTKKFSDEFEKRTQSKSSLCKKVILEVQQKLTHK